MSWSLQATATANTRSSGKNGAIVVDAFFDSGESMRYSNRKLMKSLLNKTIPPTLNSIVLIKIDNL